MITRSSSIAEELRDAIVSKEKLAIHSSKWTWLPVTLRTPSFLTTKL